MLWMTHFAHCESMGTVLELPVTFTPLLHSIEQNRIYEYKLPINTRKSRFSRNAKLWVSWQWRSGVDGCIKNRYAVCTKVIGTVILGRYSPGRACTSNVGTLFGIWGLQRGNRSASSYDASRHGFWQLCARLWRMGGPKTSIQGLLETVNVLLNVIPGAEACEAIPTHDLGRS